MGPTSDLEQDPQVASVWGQQPDSYPLTETALARFYRPLWQVYLFTVLTGILYSLWLAARIWRMVALLEGDRTNVAHPRWRAVWMIIPIASQITLARMITRIRGLEGPLGPKPASSAWSIGLLSGVGFVLVRLLPFGWDLLGFVVVSAALARVQAEANALLAGRGLLSTPSGMLRPSGVIVCLAGLSIAGYGLWNVYWPQGPVTISFGQGYDPATQQILEPTSHFGATGTIAWHLHRRQALGVQLRRTIDLIAPAEEAKTFPEVSTSVLLPTAGLGGVYERQDLSSWVLLHGLVAGTYRMRYYEGSTLIAQGTFTLDAVATVYHQVVLQTPKADPAGITEAGDGSIWFTERAAGRIGRLDTTGQVHEYRLTDNGSYPLRIVGGDQGSVWFTEAYNGAVGRIDFNGRRQEFLLNVPTAYPYQIVRGPDGAIWFVENNNGQLGRIDDQGKIREFPLGKNSGPRGLAVGPDGNFWFTLNIGKGWGIAMLSPSGHMRQFPVPGAGAANYGAIALGPDGALWFTAAKANEIGRITVDGQLKLYPLPISNAAPYEIVSANGALWFGEDNKNLLGRIATDGTITEYALPKIAGKGYAIDVLATGPDGRLWMTRPDVNQLLWMDPKTPPPPYIG
jgi:virginiamycin B lyase